MEKELPGIMNYALEGAHRLLKNLHFTTTSDQRERMKELETVSSPMKAWVVDQFNKSWINKVFTRKELYSMYNQWCQDNGSRAMSSRRFFPAIRKEFKVTEGKRNTVWNGRTVTERTIEINEIPDDLIID